RCCAARTAEAPPARRPGTPRPSWPARRPRGAAAAPTRRPPAARPPAHPSGAVRTRPAYGAAGEGASALQAYACSRRLQRTRVRRASPPPQPASPSDAERAAELVGQGLRVAGGAALQEPAGDLVDGPHYGAAVDCRVDAGQRRVAVLLCVAHLGLGD